MSFEAGGTIGAVGALCVAPIVGAVVLGGLAIGGTCLLVGKGLQLGGRAAKNAINKEVQRRREEEERRRREMQDTLLKLKEGINSLGRGETQEVEEVKKSFKEIKKTIDVSAERKLFLQNRLSMLEKKQDEIKKTDVETSKRDKLISSYSLQTEETNQRVKAIEDKIKEEEKWLSECESFLNDFESRLSDKGNIIQANEIEKQLEAIPLEEDMTEEQAEINKQKEEIEMFYETLISDTLLGTYMVTDEKGMKLSNDLKLIEEEIKKGNYDKAKEMIDKSRLLSEKIVEEFTRKYSALWSDYISRSAKESLESIGYKNVNITKIGDKKMVLGYKGITHFKFNYDSEEEKFEFDLGHDVFKSQEECNQEVTKFIDGMKGRGIAVDINISKKTYPEEEPPIDIKDEIIQAVENEGWECQISEHGDNYTLVIRRGYDEEEHEVDKESGLEAVRIIIDNLKQKSSDYEQYRNR